MAALTLEDEASYQRLVLRQQLQEAENDNMDFNRVILNDIQASASGPYWDPAQPLQPDNCTTMVELESFHSILSHVACL